MSAGEQWTDEAVRRESERWVYVPLDGVCMGDERRLLVHLPMRLVQSRVWRSSAPNEERADELVGETLGAVRAAGAGKLVWHTGEGISPLFMDECLARRGFETTEELKVLAFFLVDGAGPRLPRLGATLALTKVNIATSGLTLEQAGFEVVATELRHALEVL